MSTALAWAVIGISGGLVGVIAALVLLLHKISDRPYVTSEKLDKARQDATAAAGALGAERLAFANEREQLNDRILILQDEQKMLIAGIEEERKAWKAQEASHDVVRTQNTRLLEVIRKIAAAAPTAGGAALGDLIRAELAELSKVSALPTGPGTQAGRR